MSDSVVKTRNLNPGELYKIFFPSTPKMGMRFYSEDWKKSFFLSPDAILLLIEVEDGYEYMFAKVLFGGRLGYVLVDSTYVTIQQVS